MDLVGEAVEGRRRGRGGESPWPPVIVPAFVTFAANVGWKSAFPSAASEPLGSPPPEVSRPVSPVAVAAPKLSPWAEKPPRPPGNRCAGDVGEVAADLKEDADAAVAAATTRERAIPVATDATRDRLAGAGSMVTGRDQVVTVAAGAAAPAITRIAARTAECPE